MMKRGRASPLLAAATLVGIGFISAAAWRLEIAWHGWAGLNWIGYHHLAIPFGVILLLGWIGAFADFPSRRKLGGFLLASSLFAIGGWLVTRALLLNFFAAGPSGMALLSHFGPDDIAILQWGVLAWLAAIPLVSFGLGRGFGVDIRWPRALLGLVVYLAAYPLALAAMDFFDPPGPTDAIHTLKTGYVIPLMVIGIGLPFIGDKTNGGDR